MEHQSNEHPPESGWSYGSFVRDNPAGARALESLLQYSGFFLPARLVGRDLSIESGYALASLATLAHDRILLPLRKQGEDVGCLDAAEEAQSLGIAPGSSVRLDPKTREKSATSAFAERMQIALAVIGHVQVVLEKLAGQHGGERRRRQAITYLETLKALSRLLLLACTREMVIGGGAYVPGKRRLPQGRDRESHQQPWREVDINRRRPDSQSGPPADRPPSPPRTPEVYTGKRSGVRLLVPPRASVVWSGRGRSSRAGVGRTMTSCDGSCSERRTDGACSACRGGVFRGPDGIGCGSRSGTADGNVTCVGGQSLRRQAPLGDRSCGKAPGFSQAWLMAGEVINVLRPLVYSFSHRSSGEPSWRPWLTSLGMDAVAYACTARAGGGTMALLLPVGASVDPFGVPVLPYLDEEQTAELKRRKMLWLLYLMRSPAFELLAEPVGRGAAGVFEGVPLLGGMASYALNMLLYVQRHHFYTSAS